MTFFSLVFSLFLIMDPIGNIPLFAIILRPFDPAHQRRIIWREMLISLFILCLFEYLGAWLLRLLCVGIPTVQVSGGVILFLIALGMIFPSIGTLSSQQYATDVPPFIVPLSVPLIAGPTILATIMVYGRQIQSHFVMFSAIGIAWALSTLILIFTPLLNRLLKDQAMIAVTRLMGLILTFISVQMLLEGIRAFTSNLRLRV
jgi:multiple antibiotic resistance protein